MIGRPTTWSTRGSTARRSNRKLSYTSCEDIKTILFLSGLAMLLLPFPTMFVLGLQLQHVLLTSVISCVCMMLTGITSVAISCTAIFRHKGHVSQLDQKDRKSLSLMCRGYTAVLVVNFLMAFVSIIHSFYAISILPETGTKQWNSAYTSLFAGFLYLIISGSLISAVRTILRHCNPHSSIPYEPIDPTISTSRKKSCRMKKNKLLDLFSSNHDPETLCLLNHSPSIPIPPSYSKTEVCTQTQSTHVLQNPKMSEYSLGITMTQPRRPSAVLRLLEEDYTSV